MGEKKQTNDFTDLCWIQSVCISVVFAVKYLEAFLNMEKYIGNSLGLHEVFFIVFFCREVMLAQPFLYGCVCVCVRWEDLRCVASLLKDRETRKTEYFIICSETARKYVSLNIEKRKNLTEQREPVRLVCKKNVLYISLGMVFRG